MVEWVGRVAGEARAGGGARTRARLTRSVRRRPDRRQPAGRRPHPNTPPNLHPEEAKKKRLARTSFSRTESSSGSFDRHASKGRVHAQRSQRGHAVLGGLRLLLAHHAQHGDEDTWTEQKLDGPTRNWNWRSASTKGADSMSPTVPAQLDDAHVGRARAGRHRDGRHALDPVLDGVQTITPIRGQDLALKAYGVSIPTPAEYQVLAEDVVRVKKSGDFSVVGGDSVNYGTWVKSRANLKTHGVQWNKSSNGCPLWESTVSADWSCENELTFWIDITRIS